MEESEDIYPREDCSEESREFSPPRQVKGINFSFL